MIDAQVKTTRPETVAFIEMHGSFEQIPEAMGELYGWVSGHGFTPAGMPHAVYYTAPDDTGGTEPQWAVLAPLAADAQEAPPDEHGIGIKHEWPHLVAAAMHRGPYDTIGPTYMALKTWILEHGYRVVGPPEEVYFSDPAEVPPSEYLTEVRFPVARSAEPRGRD